MPIENRKLEAGTVLTARYKNADRRCEVVRVEDGLGYKLDTGDVYRSTSSAGKAAMGGIACNGWRFWSVLGSPAPKRSGKAPASNAAKAPAKKKPATKKATKAAKPKSQKMAAKKPAVFGCGACGSSFGSQKAAVVHAMTHVEP